MITRGFYRHYKGDVYFVEGIGQSHANEDVDTLRASVRWVLYQSTRSCQPEDGVTRMRTEREFEEWVHPSMLSPVPPPADEQRQLARDLGYVPRFERVEP